MFCFVVLFAILATFNFLPILGVIGGLSATSRQFPFQISIEYSGRHNCGGTIIGPKTILTAAHCVYKKDASSMKVLAGTIKRNLGGVRIGVRNYIAHENYVPPAKGYDIGLITLDKELIYGPTINAADLPDRDEILYNDAVATVSGWGAQFHKGPLSLDLNFVAIPLWGRDKCLLYSPKLPSTHICGGDTLGLRNSCPGDSGGPLSIGNKIIGVASFGFGCGAIFKPAMYTYVAGLRDWIQEKSGL